MFMSTAMFFDEIRARMKSVVLAVNEEQFKIVTAFNKFTPVQM